MIRNLTRAVIVVIVVLQGISAGRSVEAATTVQQDGRDLFQQALLKERADGKLEEAIEIYKSVLDVAADDHGLAAQALVRIGACYEKLGRPEASDIYERLLRDYPDQAEPVATARTQLAALEVEPMPPSPTMTVRELIRSGEQQPGDVQAVPGPGFAVTGDGQMFIYTDWNTGDLATRNMETGEVRGLYGVSWQNDSIEFFEDPVLSPDDKTVVFMRYPNGRGGADDTTRIEVDSIEGGHRETLYDAKDLINMFTKDWSLDGENILVSSEAADGSVFLATLNLTDRRLQRLVTLNWEHPRRAQYSPDGRFIAYDSTKGGDRKIYLMSADGAQEDVLVDSPGQDDSPLWTRDGRFLLFRSDRSGKWDLYAIHMHNGQPTSDDFLLKSNLGEATRLRGVTTDGRLFVYERVGGSDVAIAERTETPVETVSVTILPKILTTENSRPAFAPDGKRLAYLAGPPGMQDKTIRITDLEGRIETDIPLEPRFGTTWPPKFSSDSKKMALRVYEAGEAKIMVRSAETGRLLNTIGPLEQKGYLSPLGWSSDGRLLHVSVALETGGDAFATIDVETEQQVAWTAFPEDVRRISLSPSGDSLGIVSSPDPPAGQERRTRFVLRSLEDGSEKVFTVQGLERFLWDFDSRHLLYRKGENRLYSFSLDTEEETVVVEDMKDLRLAAVSPDGKYWAFEHYPNTRRDARILVLENYLPESTDSPGSNDQTTTR